MHATTAVTLRRILLRSVQLVARIDGLNLIIYLKSAVTLRPVLIVIGFKTIRISCIKMHTTTAVTLRRILDSLRSVKLVARIDALNLVIHLKSAVALGVF